MVVGYSVFMFCTCVWCVCLCSGLKCAQCVLAAASSDISLTKAKAKDLLKVLYFFHAIQLDYVDQKAWVDKAGKVVFEKKSFNK